MSVKTRKRLKSPPFYSVRPQAVTYEAIDELMERLELIMSLLSGIPVDKHPYEAANAMQQRRRLFIKVRNYLNDLRMAQLLLHLPSTAPEFDDHDQVASSILDMFTEYENVSLDPASPIRRGLIDEITPGWENLLPRNKRMVKSAIKDKGLISLPRVNFSEPPPVNIGVLTALEHEYQSVVRRLERIYACSDKYSYGYAIRYRKRPTDDLKDIATELKEVGISTGVGWTIGSIGTEMVMVICTGEVGKDSSRRSIRLIQERLNLSPDNWLDVGVCAGSNEKWPIGTVLISSDSIFDLTRTGSNRFRLDDDRVIRPLDLPIQPSGKFTIRTAYRRAPQNVVKGVPVAAPEGVPVLHVKFACVPDVIRDSVDREGLEKCLVDSGYLNKGEGFGMEMEGTGAPLFRDVPTMCIIKSVCDYGDNLKGGTWPPGAKMLFQLYAAETAAEYASVVIKDWSNVINLATKRMAVKA